MIERFSLPAFSMAIDPSTRVVQSMGAKTMRSGSSPGICDGHVRFGDLTRKGAHFNYERVDGNVQRGSRGECAGGSQEGEQ